MVKTVSAPFRFTWQGTCYIDTSYSTTVVQSTSATVLVLQTATMGKFLFVILTIGSVRGWGALFNRLKIYNTYSF